MKPYRIVVLASGRGSNLEKLLERFCTPASLVTIAAVISDNPQSAALKKAEELGSKGGVRCIAIDRQQFTNRATYDQQLEQAVAAENPELIVLAGYMRVLSPEFVRRFHRRIINIHPSLLPAFRGLNAQQQALDAGVRIAGCTVHYVDVEVDAGPIIAQAAVPVFADDTLELLSARILTAEHQLLPQVVELLARGAVSLKSKIISAGSAQTEHVNITLAEDLRPLRASAQDMLKGM